MVGAPHAGSFEAVRWLNGDNETLGKLSLLDITNSKRDIQKIVSRYPGILELLPHDEDQSDYADAHYWQNLIDTAGRKVPQPRVRDLRAARDSWRTMADLPSDGSFMKSVVGWSRDGTINDLKHLPPDGSGLPGREIARIEYQPTYRGDGTVTWASSRLPGVQMWYVPDAEHEEY